MPGYLSGLVVASFDSFFALKKVKSPFQAESGLIR